MTALADKKPDEYLEWLKEDADRVNWLASEARRCGLIKPTGGGATPALNRDGSLQTGATMNRPVAALSADATGHEHKGAGPGGGQFTAGSGGSTVSPDTPADKSAAHVADFHSRLGRIKNAKAVQKIKAGVDFFKGLTGKIHAKLAMRYGSKTATAILISGVVGGIPIIAVPGSTIIGMIPGVAIAETVHQLKKAMGMSSDEPIESKLTKEQMAAIFEKEVAGPLQEEMKAWAKENAADLQGLDQEEGAALSHETETALAQAEAAGVSLSDDVRDRVRAIVAERFQE